MLAEKSIVIGCMMEEKIFFEDYLVPAHTMIEFDSMKSNNE